jgi:hypothetical protein
VFIYILILMGRAQEIRARKLVPPLLRTATEKEVVFHENSTISRLLRYFVKLSTCFIWLLVYSSRHVKALPDCRAVRDSLHGLVPRKLEIKSESRGDYLDRRCQTCGPPGCVVRPAVIFVNRVCTVNIVQ